jgi:hypothetical protein
VVVLKLIFAKKDTSKFVSRPNEVGLMMLVFGIMFSSSINALPTDPQRPLEIQNCDAAKGRFYEAHLGSTLISPEEMAETTAITRDWVRRLCGSNILHKISTEIHSQKENNLDRKQP